MSDDATHKFDAGRAAEYEEQSRIALAGYDACHELTACMLAAILGKGSDATILVAGAGGTGNEILTATRLEPQWKFVAVDPSKPMLDLALSRVAQAGFAGRVEGVHGYVKDLPPARPYDAATLIGVLHHLPGDEEKHGILHQIASRLVPEAPFILACNHYSYESQPLLLSAWAERWRLRGVEPKQVKAKLDKILDKADPPQSEEVVTALLLDAGFEKPLRFFSSLFWGAWISRRTNAPLAA